MAFGFMPVDGGQVRSLASSGLGRLASFYTISPWRRRRKGRHQSGRGLSNKLREIRFLVFIFVVVATKEGVPKIWML
jgi:hypothetical protein